MAQSSAESDEMILRGMALGVLDETGILNKGLDKAIDECKIIFNSMKCVKETATEFDRPEDHVILCYSFKRFDEVKKKYKAEGLELDLKTHWKEVFKYFIECECLFETVKMSCAYHSMIAIIDMQKHDKLISKKIRTFLKLEVETREYRCKMKQLYSVCDDRIEEMYKDCVA